MSSSFCTQPQPEKRKKTPPSSGHSRIIMLHHYVVVKFCSSRRRPIPLQLQVFKDVLLSGRRSKSQRRVSVIQVAPGQAGCGQKTGGVYRILSNPLLLTQSLDAMRHLSLFISCSWVLSCALSFSSCLSSSHCFHIFSSLLSSSLLFSSLLSPAQLCTALLCSSQTWSTLVNSSQLISLLNSSQLISQLFPPLFGTSQLVSPSLSSSHLLSALPSSSLLFRPLLRLLTILRSAQLISALLSPSLQNTKAAHRHTSTVAQPLQCDSKALIAKHDGITCTAARVGNSDARTPMQAGICTEHSTMYMRSCNQEQHQCSHADTIRKQQVAKLERATCAAGTLSNAEAVTPVKFGSSELSHKRTTQAAAQQGTRNRDAATPLRSANIELQTPKPCAQWRHTLVFQNKN